VTDIVRIGDATLYHADCRDVLPTLPKFDLLLTDPPYGIGAARGSHSNLKMADEDWDDFPPDTETIALARSRSVVSILWGGNYFVLPPSRCFLFWDKTPMPPSYAAGELAWTDLALNADKWNGKVGDETPVKFRSHPTQKPVGLMVWCLSKVPTAKTVLDPFMGSGTTGVACAQSGRAFTGIERERKYFDIAVERISRAYAQGQLFEPTQPKPEQQEIAA